MAKTKPPPKKKGKAKTTDWRAAVTRSLGGRLTPSVQKFLTAWWKVEGGDLTNSARYNWLNTTHGQGFPSINSVGVKSYPNFQTGVQQLTAVLRSGYPSLTRAIRSGKVDLSNPGVQADLNRWLTGNRTPGMTEYVGKIASSLGVNIPAGKGSGLLSLPASATTAALPSEITYGGPSEVLGPSFGAPMPFKVSKIDVSGLPKAMPANPTPVVSGKQVAGEILVPTHFKSTHDTDGIAGYQPSTDITSVNGHAVRPGMPVGAPEAGVITAHGHAQGGLSLTFRGVSGRVYWLGHIDHQLPIGRHVRKGDVIAFVANQHVSIPHVHVGILSG